MPHTHKSRHEFGCLPESDGYRFHVYAEGVDRITITLNDIEYPLEQAPLKPDVYTFFMPNLSAPFHYVYNVFKRGDFYPDLLDPFCSHTNEEGVKSVYKEEKNFVFKHEKPNHPPEKLIIYELCVRAYTKDSSSEVSYPGTFEGLIEKLDYIKNLGVTAIELMPITLFNPSQLWGYMPRSFMALSPHLSATKNPSLSLKKLVDAAHEKGLEVFLDLVFNHTDVMETTLYPFCDDFYLKNYDATGCGNTLNVQHPVIRKLLIEACHIFVEQYQIDGIRFDLGLALCRDEKGEILSDPPFIHELENLFKKKIKIFYEPWDTAGYRLYDFPTKNGIVWDDQIRDTIRRFVRMDEGQIPLIHQRIHSPNMVKMVTCHDGFTLYDLVSYEQKHNLSNGYKNRDGHGGNYSCNCGVEGETEDQRVLTRRFRKAEILYGLLFSFCGPILLNAGDEFLSTHYGNNNPFNQDNRISYIEWHRKLYPSFLDFTKKLIHLFKTTPLSNPQALVQFHGSDPNIARLQPTDHLLAFTKKDASNSIFVAINTWKEPLSITLPSDDKGEWKIVLSTSQNPLVLEQDTMVIALLQ